MNNNTNSQYANKSNAELLAIINGLEAKVAAKNKPTELTFHVSDATGVLMVRGLGRYPLCAYYAQWQRFLAKLDAFRAFLEQVKAFVPNSKDEAVDKAKLSQLPAGIVVTPQAKKEEAN